MAFEVLKAGPAGPKAAERALAQINQKPGVPLRGFFAVTIHEDGTYVVDAGGLIEAAIVLAAIEDVRKAREGMQGGGTP